ncbi:hypothetical protein [Agrobacterium vaccinii]|uniref:hypothetical protein n=1 Tax=Agrobacterium vaccinii TaxID=2735528 RepID=UPI001E2C9D96|nr:hypothetical protein [Agrobacterium vaccinii]
MVGSIRYRYFVALKALYTERLIGKQRLSSALPSGQFVPSLPGTLVSAGHCVAW